MTAATENRFAAGRVYTGRSVLPYTLTDAAHVYRNTLAVVLLSTGLVVDWTTQEENLLQFIGVHTKEVHDSDDAKSHIRGDKAAVASSGTIQLVCDSAVGVPANMGKAVAGLDNQTVQLRTGSGDEMYVGRIVDIISTTLVEVEIDVAALEIGTT